MRINSTFTDFVGLEVATGENLTLVGGNIIFEIGQATARGGNIQLGGLAAAGTVGINDDGSLSFPENVAKADITLSNAADVDVRGTDGGSITINARNLNLEAGFIDGSLIRAGIAANSGFDGAQAGDINVNATGAINLSALSSIQNDVNEDAIGNSGDINVTAQSLTLTENSFYSASTFGQGNGGAVNITATDSVSFDGGGAFSTVEVTGEGTAGGIKITTSNLSLTNGGRLVTSTFGKGDAGNITVNTNSLSVNNNAVLSASTFGKGNGGIITINATDSVSFDNSGNAFNTVEATGEGNAGGIKITTFNLSLTKGGQLSASTRGQGNAGNVTVNANSIFLDGEDNQGAPSGVFSQVGDDKQLVIPEGNAGRIEIKTNSLSVKNNAQLSASTFGKGNGGSITINATDSVSFDGGSAFNSVAVTGIGDAGEIKITTANLSLTNGGQL